MLIDLGNGVLVDRDKQLRALDRVEYEESLYLFLRAAWKQIDSSPWTDGWPIEAIAEHLQAVIDGDIKRLIINLPPRFGKSSVTSVALPAWTWAQPNQSATSGPGVQFLHASYAQSLSLRDSVKCRRLIQSPWYQSMWGDRFAISGDQNVKSRFSNDKGGERLITSIGAGVTGEGGSCFPAGTLVATPTGERPIEQLRDGDEVLAFDHSLDKVVKSKVIATAQRLSNDLQELRTFSGHRFVCTGNHPIFSTGRGYIRADQMGRGDGVLFRETSTNWSTNSGAEPLVRSLQRTGSQDAVRGPQGAQAEQSRRLLQLGLFAGPPRGEEYKTVRDVRQVPQDAPSWSTAVIERVCRHNSDPVCVYDIQVEGHSNFFANGILVHNCIIIDDPNAANEAFSEATIQSTIDWWDGTMSTRLNDMKTGAYIIIQQRLAEDDLTGHILSKDIGEWTHLVLPMKYEPDRSFTTKIGWKDPRHNPGDLLWPERFGADEVNLLEKALGPFGTAGQLQQRPEPAGGGVIKRDWWQLWEEAAFPPMDFILASLDTAYTEKTTNDFSAMTVWGVFSGDAKMQANRVLDQDGRPIYMDRSYTEGAPKVMLMHAWKDRLELHDLVVKIAETAKRFKIDKMIIEAKASGHSVAQEIKRLYGHENFSVQLIDPKSQDKLARLYSVQHIWAEKMIYAPERAWADMVITQVGQFPKGKYDDLVDTCSQAIRHLRDIGLLVRGPERLAEIEDMKRFTGREPGPLYPV